MRYKGFTRDFKLLQRNIDMCKRQEHFKVNDFVKWNLDFLFRSNMENNEQIQSCRTLHYSLHDLSEILSNIDKEILLITEEYARRY